MSILYGLGGLGKLDERERWQLYEAAKQRRDDFNKQESDAVLAMLEL